MSDETTLYKDYLTTWFKSKRYSLGPQTVKTNDSYIRNQIVPLLGNFSLSALTPMILQAFVHDLIEKGFSHSTVKRILAIVSSSLETAVNMELIPKNNTQFVNRPRVRLKVTAVWDLDQVRHFLEVASQDPFTHGVFHLALLTGMRQGEILGLRWGDIHLDTETLYIRQTISHDGKEVLLGAKTRSGVRSIALDHTTVAVLERHKRFTEEFKMKYGANLRNEDSVFYNSSGQRLRPRYVMSVWYKRLKESGLPKITFHDLRHTHASLLLKNNVHPKIVSERLGHSSIQITLDTYSHLLPNMQKDAADKLGESLFGV